VSGQVATPSGLRTGCVSFGERIGYVSQGRMGSHASHTCATKRWHGSGTFLQRLLYNLHNEPGNSKGALASCRNRAMHCHVVSALFCRLFGFKRRCWMQEVGDGGGSPLGNEKEKEVRLAREGRGWGHTTTTTINVATQQQTRSCPRSPSARPSHSVSAVNSPVYRCCELRKSATCEQDATHRRHTMFLCCVVTSGMEHKWD
jgi:hypothetical protein